MSCLNIAHRGASADAPENTLAAFALAIEQGADPDKLEDVELKKASLIAMAQLAVRQGLFTRAVEAGERLLELGATEDRDTLLTLALARAMSGDPKSALELMAKVEALGEPKDAIEAVGRLKHYVLIRFNNRDYDAAVKDATELAALARDAEGVRNRQMRLASRRLASAQKRALSEAARSGRIGEAIARRLSKDIEVALEEEEIASSSEYGPDPNIYPDPSPD